MAEPKPWQLEHLECEDCSRCIELDLPDSFMINICKAEAGRKKIEQRKREVK